MPWNNSFASCLGVNDIPVSDQTIIASMSGEETGLVFAIITMLIHIYSYKVNQSISATSNFADYTIQHHPTVLM